MDHNRIMKNCHMIKSEILGWFDSCLMEIKNLYRKKLEKDLLRTMQILEKVVQICTRVKLWKFVHEKVVQICTLKIQGFVKWELDKSLKKMWKFAHVKLRKFSHLKSGKNLHMKKLWKYAHEKVVKISLMIRGTCTMYIIKLEKIIDDQGQQVYILSNLLDKVFC